LRWHYTGAYVIQHAAPDVWIAQRTDNNGTLRASTPDALRDLIRADYADNPVPRVRDGLRISQAARRWS
jgi:hypothetical protein